MHLRGPGVRARSVGRRIAPGFSSYAAPQGGSFLLLHVTETDGIHFAQNPFKNVFFYMLQLSCLYRALQYSWLDLYHLPTFTAVVVSCSTGGDYFDNLILQRV